MLRHFIRSFNMRNKLFSSLIIIFLITGLFTLFGEQKSELSLERRYASSANDIDISLLVNGELVSNTEDVLKDQFYFRNTILSSYYSFKLSFYNLISDEMILLEDDVLLMRDGYYIYSIIDKLDTNLIKNKAYNVKNISEMYPDISVYQYFPTRIEETNLLDINSNVYSKVQGARDIYLSELGDKVKTDSLELNSISDYESYYYKSDHHWNYLGSYQGYSDIIELINDDYPEIGMPKEIKEIIKYDNKFYGSFSSKTGLASGYDYFTDFSTDNNKLYDYYVDSVLTDEGIYKEAYDKAKQEGNAFYHDYDLYFGPNSFERIYINDGNTKPNILIFSDSFINPIKDDLANHFGNTVILDMRSSPDDFNLDYYIEQYDIDIILFMYMYDNLYSNGDFFIPLNN